MRRAFLIVLVAVGLCGCRGEPLAPKVAAALDVAECQVRAVRALVPHVETADAVVAAVRARDYGRAVVLMKALEMAPADIQAVAAAFDACTPPAPPPVPPPESELQGA